ncbi:MAG: transposase [Advenella sp.]
MDNTNVSSNSYRHLSRRHFTKEFKRNVVERLLNNGLTVAEVAREHDLHPNQLCRWRNEYRTQQLIQNADNREDTALLPVTLTAEPFSNQGVVAGGQNQLMHNSAQVALTIKLSKGSLLVHDRCPAQLLCLAIEALK